MNQYTSNSKVPSLLKPPMKETSTARLINGMVEVIVNGERVVVPSMDSYAKLTAKVSSLENRLSNLENKINRLKRPE